jgi:hypothetical protein
MTALEDAAALDDEPESEHAVIATATTTAPIPAAHLPLMTRRCPAGVGGCVIQGG